MSIEQEIQFKNSAKAVIPQKHVWERAVSNGHSYRYVTNDPIAARFYTLQNGLTVIMSVNKAEPRIAVNIAVRAGSVQDPKECVGVAHLLEHLLFNGTDKYGTVDWNQEKPVLEKLELLYDQYNRQDTAAARAEIHKQIHAVSRVASEFVIAGEYDKLISTMGSLDSNAHTSFEQTVFEEDISCLAIDKFLALQGERFRSPVFRSFETEVETIYNEISDQLEDDNEKISIALHSILFPTHRYGNSYLQNMGHPNLISPQLVRDYFEEYYVPNNMAVILAGDFDPDEMIVKIEAAFCYMVPKPMKKVEVVVEEPLVNPVIKNIFGPTPERVLIGFRTPSSNTRDGLVMNLVCSILYNGTVGLFDNTFNKDKAFPYTAVTLEEYNDYSMLVIGGVPKAGQTLEYVKDFLLGRLEHLKKGLFEDHLIQSIVANRKIGVLGLDDNDAVVSGLTDEYVQSGGRLWDKMLSWLDDMSMITKEEVIEVSKKYIGSGYSLLYKRKGKDRESYKRHEVNGKQSSVRETNDDLMSPFAKEIELIPLRAASSQSHQQKDKADVLKAGIADLFYSENKKSDLAKLQFQFDIGSWNQGLLPFATQYLEFVGTEKYTNGEIKKLFYSLGGTYSFEVERNNSTITISSLQENFDKILVLFNELIKKSRQDKYSLASFKQMISVSRLIAKQDKSAIMEHLVKYARFGVNNSRTSLVTSSQRSRLNGGDLIDMARGLFSYPHTIKYCGPEEKNKLVALLTRLRLAPTKFEEIPASKSFSFEQQTSNKILFVHHETEQAEIYWVRNGSPADEKESIMLRVFSEYFGEGSGSVVFKELRESRTLAYDTWADCTMEPEKNIPLLIDAYIECRVDKIEDAIMGMTRLFNHMPQWPRQLEAAKAFVKANVRNEDFDPNLTPEEINNSIDSIEMEDMVKLHRREIAGKHFTLCIIANKKMINMKALKKFGTVKRIRLRKIFGY